MSNVLAFIQAHWLAAFSAWVTLNAIASMLEAKLGPVPTNTWYGKALHVFMAISPMDVMKAWKALGGALVPPSAGAVVTVMALCFCLGGSAVGCSMFSSTPSTSAATATASAQVRAAADAATSLMETAWKDSAQACLDAANAAHDDTIRQKCEPPLTKARQALLLAQASIDTWTAADQKNFPCLVDSALLAFGELEGLGNFKLPQSLVDMETLAQSYAGQCTSIQPLTAAHVRMASPVDAGVQ